VGGIEGYGPRQGPNRNNSAALLMGGPGSGWNHRGSRFLTVEACYDLDIAELAKAGYFSRPGYKAASTWSWTSSGAGQDGKVTTVKVEIDLTDAEAPRFAIIYGAEVDGAPREDLTLRGELYTTTPHYGGVRYWFRCPRCWRRARVLYAYPQRGRERFWCRQCQCLRYYVHNEAPAYRWARRARKCFKRAGSHDGTEPWQKPKWMRWDTFSRLVLAGRDARDIGDGMILAGLSAGLASIQRRQKRGR
jgi:hypothetical protein